MSEVAIDKHIDASTDDACKWCRRPFSASLKRRTLRAKECLTCPRVIYKCYPVEMRTQADRTAFLAKMGGDPKVQTAFNEQVEYEEEHPGKRRRCDDGSCVRSGLGDTISRAKGRYLEGSKVLGVFWPSWKYKKDMCYNHTHTHNPTHSKQTNKQTNETIK